MRHGDAVPGKQISVRPDSAAAALVLSEQVSVRWRYHDVVHHRAGGLGQDRSVQVSEQAGVAPEGRRHDSEIVHHTTQNSAVLEIKRVRYGAGALNAARGRSQAVASRSCTATKHVCGEFVCYEGSQSSLGPASASHPSNGRPARFSRDVGQPADCRSDWRRVPQRPRAVLQATNEQIKQLAPVLNSPSVTSGWSTSASIRAMVNGTAGISTCDAGSRLAATSSSCGCRDGTGGASPEGPPDAGAHWAGGAGGAVDAAHRGAAPVRVSQTGGSGVYESGLGV